MQYFSSESPLDTPDINKILAGSYIERNFFFYLNFAQRENLQKKSAVKMKGVKQEKTDVAFNTEAVMTPMDLELVCQQGKLPDGREVCSSFAKKAVFRFYSC